MQLFNVVLLCINTTLLFPYLSYLKIDLVQLLPTLIYLKLQKIVSLQIFF